MTELKKYSIELLASMIGDRILFEDRDFETWEEVEICFEGMNAFISGVMYSEEIHSETVLHKADLDKVVLLFTDNDNQTDFNFDELVELDGLIKLYK